MSLFPRSRFQWRSHDIASDLDKLTDIDATGAEINAVKGLPFGYTVTPAAGAANVCEVTIQAKDANGDNLNLVAPLLVCLSDAATGAGLTGTTASGAASRSRAPIFAFSLTKKALLVQTSAAGVYVLSITDTANTLFKVCVQSLSGGTPAIATLTADDYGS